MKKKVLTGLITLVLVLGVFASAAWAVDYSYLKMSLLAIGDKTAFVNDKEITLNAAPYIKSGKTLVPLRFMENALGAEIGWEKVTRTATLKTKSMEVKVAIGQKNATVNGKSVALDVPAEIKNNMTFVPLRFVSENLGAKVEYEAETKTISIKYVDKTGWKQSAEVVSGLSVQYPADWQVAAEGKNSIKLETPNGTIFEFKSDARALAAVVKEKKDNHNKDGWTIIAEEPVDPQAPSEGTAISALKGGIATPGKAEIYVATIMKTDKDDLFVVEITGLVENSDQDMMLLEDMLPE